VSSEARAAVATRASWDSITGVWGRALTGVNIGKVDGLSRVRSVSTIPEQFRAVQYNKPPGPLRRARWRGAAPSSGSHKKKRNPRGLRLRFHQRRRFWRSASTGSRHVPILPSQSPKCKRFLLPRTNPLIPRQMMY